MSIFEHSVFLGEKKAKLKEWISNAGLDTEMWFSVMSRYGVTSVTDLVAVSNINSAKIVKAARNSREEAAVGRLLRLDLSGGAGGMTKCLKGCGMWLKVDDLGGHNCLEVLTAKVDRLTGSYDLFIDLTVCMCQLLIVLYS